MIRTMAMLFALHAALASADLVWDAPADLRSRPGMQQTFTYAIDPAPAAHSLEIVHLLSGVTVTGVSSTAAGGTFRIAVDANADNTSGRIEIRAMQGQIPLTTKRSLDLTVDVAPQLAG